MALKEIGIKKIAFSQNNGTIAEIRTKDLNLDNIDFSSGFRQLERDILELGI
jgi:hypothetical protein